jgi:hypothetical protein
MKMSNEVKTGSKSFSLDLTDVIELGKGALLVGTAAALTFIGENIVNIDLGPMTAFVVPIVTVAIHSLGRWIKDFSNPVSE